jgi:hypothetical protein
MRRARSGRCGFRAGQDQVWGINFRRNIQAQDRVRLPHAAAARRPDAARARARSRSAATLVGLAGSRRKSARNSTIKPAGVATLNDRPRGRAPDRQRRLGPRRPRPQGRHRLRFDGRRHAVHRLRPGRGRRGAGQPHALQPLPPREARVLPRGPGPLRLRRRRQHGRQPRAAAAHPSPRWSSSAGKDRCRRRQHRSTSSRAAASRAVSARGRSAPCRLRQDAGGIADSDCRSPTSPAVRAAPRPPEARSSVGAIYTRRSHATTSAGRRQPGRRHQTGCWHRSRRT